MPQIIQLNRRTDDESNPVTWVDLDLREDDSADWIENESGLSAEIMQRLLKNDELSQREVYDNGMLISIHAKSSPLPVKMIRNRLASGSIGIGSLRFDRRPVRRLMRIRAAAQDKTKHWEPYQILVFLLRASLKRFEPLISNIFSRTTKLEDQILDAADDSVDDDELNVVRHQTIRARQHLVMLRNLPGIRNCR